MKQQEKQTDLVQLFEQVLKDNTASIYRICKTYALAPLEPQDLFQEVVFQIWKSLPSFKGKSSINTWVYRIALNVCFRAKLNWNKKEAKTIRLESIQFSLADRAIDEEQLEKHRALKACIEVLNETDQSIIILYLEALPYKEIAAITGLSENHIAVKMKRIREKLLTCITPKLK